MSKRALPKWQSGFCDCGNVATKKRHGRFWVCDRCERIEIEFNKRRSQTAATTNNERNQRDAGPE